MHLQFIRSSYHILPLAVAHHIAHNNSNLSVNILDFAQIDMLTVSVGTNGDRRWDHLTMHSSIYSFWTGEHAASHIMANQALYRRCHRICKITWRKSSIQTFWYTFHNREDRWLRATHTRRQNGAYSCPIDMCVYSMRAPLVDWNWYDGLCNWFCNTNRITKEKKREEEASVKWSRASKGTLSPLSHAWR